MPDGNVVLFTDIVFQIVKLNRPVGFLGDILPNAFPIAHPHGLPLALLVKFPVEINMVALLAGPAQQGWNHRNTINAFRSFYTDQLAAGRQEIPERRDMITDRVGFYPARPAGNHRHTNAALVQCPFVAFKRARTVKELRIRSAFLVRAVIAGKHYQRIFIQLKFFELRHQSADVAIHPRYHCGVTFLRLGPVLIGVGFKRGHFHALIARFVVSMRDSQGQIKEERIALILLHEAQSLLGKQIVRITLAPGRDAAGRPVPPADDVIDFVL